LPRAPDSPIRRPSRRDRRSMARARAAARGARSRSPRLDAYRRLAPPAPRLHHRRHGVNLGRLFAENSDPPAAGDCFRRALELDPADATAYYNLGVLAQDAGRSPTRSISIAHGALRAATRTLADAHLTPSPRAVPRINRATRRVGDPPHQRVPKAHRTLHEEAAARGPRIPVKKRTAATIKLSRAHRQEIDWQRRCPTPPRSSRGASRRGACTAGSSRRLDNHHHGSDHVSRCGCPAPDGAQAR